MSFFCVCFFEEKRNTFILFLSSFRDSTYTDADNIPDDIQGDFNGGMEYDRKTEKKNYFNNPA